MNTEQENRNRDVTQTSNVNPDIPKYHYGMVVPYLMNSTLVSGRLSL
jgi:hypothetical protein